jgi:NADH:ubiquinone oxidoreductase subunit 3 (subunit A)
MHVTFEYMRMYQQRKALLMYEYLPFLMYFLISLGLSMLILGLSFVFSTQKADPEKVSAYECGFDPFDDARARFDIRFYLVAILFIIFDLEVTFLFPLAISLHQINLLGFWSIVVFLLVLTVGFVYEWRKGALEWE